MDFDESYIFIWLYLLKYLDTGFEDKDLEAVASGIKDLKFLGYFKIYLYNTLISDDGMEELTRELENKDLIAIVIWFSKFYL